eukprot:2193372-Prymnesium_polylepis.1
MSSVMDGSGLGAGMVVGAWRALLGPLKWGFYGSVRKKWGSAAKSPVKSEKNNSVTALCDMPSRAQRSTLAVARKRRLPDARSQEP